jgi:hypothetical protein
MNNDLNINGAGVFHEFDLTFSKPIDSISFDYEIFPGKHWHVYESSRDEVPGGHDCDRDVHVDRLSALSRTLCVDSGKGASETHSQLGPQSTGPIVLEIPGGTELQFTDWPSEIGVSNLWVTFDPPPPSRVPEPASIVLLGSCLLGLLTLIHRKMRDSVSCFGPMHR